MGWRMIGKPIYTADNAATKPAISQSIELPAINASQYLKGVGVGVILFNDPAFTDVRAEIWSDDAGAPGVLIAQSTNVWTKAELLTVDIHGYKLIGFTFDPFAIKSGNIYRAAIRMTGYTGDAASHIAWRHSYPDPQYQSGLTLDAAHAVKHPLEITIFSAEA
jgi:hypothetical protein